MGEHHVLNTFVLKLSICTIPVLEEDDACSRPNENGFDAAPLADGSVELFIKLNPDVVVADEASVTAGVGLKEKALCEDGADVVEVVDLTKLNPLVVVLGALVVVLNADEDGAAATEALVSVWEYLLSISCRCFL